MKTHIIKSLWMSAPFWKTESGMTMRGLPVGEMETGANLRRVLSSAALIFSTREGGVGREGGLGLGNSGGRLGGDKEGAVAGFVCKGDEEEGGRVE